jgi:hypothetical protein
VIARQLHVAIPADRPALAASCGEMKMRAFSMAIDFPSTPRGLAAAPMSAGQPWSERL